MEASNSTKRPILEKAERETIILYNAEDLTHGYFVFGTSERREWRKLLKRVGGESNLLRVRLQRDSSNRIVWYEAQVPVEMRSQGTFGIRLNKRQCTEKGSTDSHSKHASQLHS